MDAIALIELLAIALGIGLMIGVERGWKERDEAEGGRVAGIRTFALVGLLGGIWGALARLGGEAGLWALGIAFAVFSAGIILLHRRESDRDHDVGSTTVVAAMLTFALGAFAVLGDKTVASAAAVTVTLLLASKAALHRWVQRLKWEELRAGLILLAMTVVLLPLLPDRPIGPLQVINPRQIWIMTIMIAAVSAAGYLAIKTTGARRGTILSALAGGLVSSTVVTIHMARLAGRYPERSALFAGGAVLAGATMMIRIVVVASFFNIELLRWLAPPLGAAGLVLVLFSWRLLGRREGDLDHRLPLALKSPFELNSVLGFGLLLAVVLVLAKGLTAVAGASGAYALGAISGLADVDTVSLSMAQLSRTALDPQVASVAILFAAISNTLSKAVLAWIAGGRRIGLIMMLAAAVAVLAVVLTARYGAAWEPTALLDRLRGLPAG